MTKETKEGIGSSRTPLRTSDLLSPKQVKAGVQRKEALLKTKKPKHLSLREGYPLSFGDPKGIDREELFAQPFKIMREMAGEVGAQFPDDALSRLVIADRDALVDILLPFVPPEEIDSRLKTQMFPLGFILPGNIAVVNAWRIGLNYTLGDKDREKEKQEKHRRNTKIREEGVKQLWRLAAWHDGGSRRLPTYGHLVFRTARDGIFTRNNTNSYVTHGMFDLDHDTHNFLTRRTLERGGYKVKKAYDLTSQIVDSLIQKHNLTEQPFIAAFLTADGLSRLRDILEQTASLQSTYGENVLWNLARELGTPLKTSNGKPH